MFARPRPIRATMASYHARLFHGRCVAAKVSLAEAAGPETKQAAIDNATGVVVASLEAALATRVHGEAIAQKLDELTAAVVGIGLPGDGLLIVLGFFEKIGTAYGGNKSWSMQGCSTMFQNPR